MTMTIPSMTTVEIVEVSDFMVKNGVILQYAVTITLALGGYQRLRSLSLGKHNGANRLKKLPWLPSLVTLKGEARLQG